MCHALHTALARCRWQRRTERAWVWWGPLTEGWVGGEAVHHASGHKPAHAVSHEHHAERLLLLLPLLTSLLLSACRCHGGSGGSMLASQVLNGAQHKRRLVGLQCARASNVGGQRRGHALCTRVAGRWGPVWARSC